MRKLKIQGILGIILGMGVIYFGLTNSEWTWFVLLGGAIILFAIGNLEKGR